MDSTLNNKVVQERPTSLEEQLSNFAREAGVTPSSPTISMKLARALRMTLRRLRDMSYPVSIGLLLLGCIGGGTWWWASVGTAVVPSSNYAPLTQAPPKEIAPTALVASIDLATQLQPIARDLASLRQAVEQLQLRQEQFARDNDRLASQLSAGQAESTRINTVVDQIKAVQVQMAQEGKTVAERLNASQEQLARLIDNAPAPKEQASDEPKASPNIPLPRPRRSTNATQTHKPTPTAARPQASRPQPATWPWSAR
ncbi:hypothetical protein [Bradyrhizobium sp. CCBAU 53421]|uniref:hypothetical protein n=1 Tax=Bradyrhizobium sp. CCBAU 53421 TaxID=1325120 RepID=UPI00188AD966|nr:hypothetical protein [Bradyrhizobium sp. CCBAU 53421]QOZ35154.1 hypothetical protein XH92_28645 [Bradyrhizobium sp. CCBAU 53421]